MCQAGGWVRHYEESNTGKGKNKEVLSSCLNASTVGKLGQKYKHGNVSNSLVADIPMLGFLRHSTMIPDT
jgi:hypothetical protein